MNRVIKISLGIAMGFVILVVAVILVLNAKTKSTYKGIIADSNIAYEFRNDTTGKALLISMEKGPHYAEMIKNQGFLDYVVVPLIAIWVEDSEGNYVDTLFVSSKVFEINRPSALPVWAHKSQMQSSDLADEVSGASNQDVSRSFEPSDDESFRILMEVNRSYDYNAFYKGDKDYNGQPSLVYEGLLTGVNNMVLVGHGSIDGTDGEIDEPLNEVTTAKEIFKEIVVEIK